VGSLRARGPRWRQATWSFVAPDRATLELIADGVFAPASHSSPRFFSPKKSKTRLALHEKIGAYTKPSDEARETSPKTLKRGTENPMKQSINAQPFIKTHRLARLGGLGWSLVETCANEAPIAKVAARRKAGENLQAVAQRRAGRSCISWTAPPPSATSRRPIRPSCSEITTSGLRRMAFSYTAPRACQIYFTGAMQAEPRCPRPVSATRLLIPHDRLLETA